MPGNEHLAAIERVYGPEAWDLYARLDRSLEPRSPELLHELAAKHLAPGMAVLDVGCRDGAHLIELVRATGTSGVGLDPVTRLLDAGREAVEGAGLADRIRFVEGAIEDLPFADGSFDLVWCRDVLEIVGNVAGGMAEIARVLMSGGHAVVFTVFATDLLEPHERRLVVGQNLTLVEANLDPEHVEAAFGKAGLHIELKDDIGTEWREHIEERTQVTSRDLLRLARLRRQRDEIIAVVGEELYGHLESNLHWSTYQFLGKLAPTVYLLRRD